jgi:hypothetical protein
MIGLMVLGALALYLIVSIWVTKKASNWAKANNKKPWVWGGLAAFVMYNLVFWDLIPTLVMHKYYCATQAGFWVYKTPVQWGRENPEMMGKLARSLEPKKIEKLPNGIKRYWLTQRFYNDILQKKVFLSVSKRETTFYDAKTKELISKSTNFYRGVGNLMVSGGSLNEWRQAFSVSLGNRSCGEKNKSPTDLFDQFIYQFWKSGESLRRAYPLAVRRMNIKQQ